MGDELSSLNAIVVQVLPRPNLEARKLRKRLQPGKKKQLPFLTILHMPPPTEFAEFTADGDRRVVCQRCRCSYPPGTPTFFMRAAANDEPGKKVCSECRQYYREKTRKATERRLNTVSNVNQSHLSEAGNSGRITLGENKETNLSAQLGIRKAVAEAQRRGKSLQVYKSP